MKVIRRKMRMWSSLAAGMVAVMMVVALILPFIPVNAVASGGPLIGEGARDIDITSPPPQLCLAEDPVISGNMQVLGAGCVCTLSTFPNHQTLRKFSGTTLCLNTAGVPGAGDS